MSATIQQIHPDAAQATRLLQIWESAVRATHHFLSEEDIQALKPLVAQAIAGIETLCCAVEPDGQLTGFLGMEGDKIEILFVDNAARGGGVGKLLLTHAVKQLGARYVDVNEQNPSGRGFYQHMGFVVLRRSAFDSQGNPFPILHLALAAEAGEGGLPAGTI